METIQPYCSPKASSTHSTSCFNYDTLLLLARLYNNNHDDKIDIGQMKTKRKLWLSLNDKLSSQCGSKETCWIEQPFVIKSSQKDLIEKNFRPKKPFSWKKNPREWLNTYDIMDVVKQYEDADKLYHFVGVFPVDFASKNISNGQCIVQEMCQLNLHDQWVKGIRKIGIVFNLDRHDQSGSHWTSCYIGLDPKRRNFGVYYYDSVASNPPKEISKFMKDKQSELLKIHKKTLKKTEYRINKIRKQYKSTECGIFSILFQILMLKYSFDKVCESMGFDDDVVKFRDILYRPS